MHNCGKEVALFNRFKNKTINSFTHLDNSRCSKLNKLKFLNSYYALYGGALRRLPLILCTKWAVSL